MDIQRPAFDFRPNISFRNSVVISFALYFMIPFGLGLTSGIVVVSPSTVNPFIFRGSMIKRRYSHLNCHFNVSFVS